MLVLADDLTGAIDTGVQFAKRGLRTSVIVGIECDFSSYPDTDVFVIDTETRHLCGEDAYKTLYEITKKASSFGISHFLKKTDSGLRGNISSEITAVMDASGIKVAAFIPAFPQMNRVVVGGISYIDGMPINKSVFGTDPFNPVKIERVADLFTNQKHAVREYSDSAGILTQRTEEQIAVFDSATRSDIRAIVDVLEQNGYNRLYAGCAGLADVLAEEMGSGEAPDITPERADSFLAVCGSINPISQRQIQYAAQQGYKRLNIPGEEINDTAFSESNAFNGCINEINSALAEHKVCLVDTGNVSDKPDDHVGISNDFDPDIIAGNLGKILGATLAEGMHPVIMIIGGDTLYHITDELSCLGLQLISEPERGVACIRMKTGTDEYTALTKSGGFGDEQLIVRLISRFLSSTH